MSYQFFYKASDKARQKMMDMIPLPEGFKAAMFSGGAESVEMKLGEDVSVIFCESGAFVRSVKQLRNPELTLSTEAEMPQIDETGGAL